MPDPIEQHIRLRIAKLRRSRRSIKPGSRSYSPELFVLTRLLEFPFSKYPARAYPGHLLVWPHMRWRHVEQIIRFCENLRQPKGSRAGEPVRLLGFQVLILLAIFGPEDPDTKRRLARTVVMTISRKNGKSALVAMALLAVMSLTVFNLKAQEIQVGASDREQASILFDLTKNLILMDKDLGLNERFHIVPSRKQISHRMSHCRLSCLSSDAYRAHGANPAIVLLDEFGNIPDNRAREFYGVLSTAFGSQEEPLLLMFSTQSPDDSHIFSEFVDRAGAINEGTREDPGLVGILFELPKLDDGTGLVLEAGPDVEPAENKADARQPVDVYAEANWARSNPALEGVSPHGFKLLADMRTKAREAHEIASLENSFRNLQLNQRIARHSPFLSPSIWEGSLVEPLSPEQLEGCICYAAGDLSETTDLSALTYVWQLPDMSFYALIVPYTPREGIEARTRVSHVPYASWVEQGHLRTCEGRTIDYSDLAADLVGMDTVHQLEAVGFDRYKWDQIRKECAALEWEPYEAEPGEFWVPIGQGFVGMAPCVDALERLLLAGRLKIARNPVATWCASNAVTLADGQNNRKFERQKSYGKIDCIVALAMAAWLAARGDLDERAGESATGAGYDAGAELMLL